MILSRAYFKYKQRMDFVRMLDDIFMLLSESKPYKFKRKDNHLICCKRQAMSIKLELDNGLQWLVVLSPLSVSSISNRVNV